MEVTGSLALILFLLLFRRQHLAHLPQLVLQLPSFKWHIISFLKLLIADVGIIEVGLVVERSLKLGRPVVLDLVVHFHEPVAAFE